MIKDGVDTVVADYRGWLPIAEAPLATNVYSGRDIAADPMRIEGITTHGRIVEAWYYAASDYLDRWCDVTGRVVYRLTHFRRVG